MCFTMVYRLFVFLGGIDHAYSEGERLKVLVSEAGISQVLDERFSPTKILHAAVEIGVRRLVATHQSSDEREYMREVGIIEPSYKAITRIAKLQNCQLSSRP